MKMICLLIGVILVFDLGFGAGLVDYLELESTACTTIHVWLPKKMDMNKAPANPNAKLNLVITPSASTKDKACVEYKYHYLEKDLGDLDKR